MIDLINVAELFSATESPAISLSDWLTVTLVRFYTLLIKTLERMVMYFLPVCTV